MNCKAVRKRVVVGDSRNLPAVIAEHLQGCSACRAFLAGMSTVQALLALKRYETPDAGFENRSAENIRLSLQDVSPGELHGWGRVLWTPAFFLRAAAAALLVLLVGFHVRSVRLSSLSSGVAASPREPAAVVERMMAPAPVNLFAQPAPVMMLAQSNNGPGEIQYGPLPSRTVRFDY